MKVWTLLPLLALGCAHGSRVPGAVDVEVDARFGDARIDAIREALSSWETATDGAVVFTMRVLPPGDLADADGRIVVRDEAPDSTWPSIFGFTMRVPHDHNVRTSVLLRDDVGVGVFQISATHEFGHALGLDHYNGPEPTLMCARLVSDAPVPQPRDVVALFDAWK